MDPFCEFLCLLAANKIAVVSTHWKCAGCGHPAYSFLRSLRSFAVKSFPPKKSFCPQLFCQIFPLPPLPEQTRIAETLNLAQREIGLLKKLAEKQKLQKRGLMQKLLTGEWRVGKEGEAGLARTEGKG